MKKKNSGYKNSGDCNTGDYNSGYKNSGDYNSGDCNSGSYNLGHCNSGHFNTTEPTVRMFNRDTGLKAYEINLPYIHLNLKNKSYKEAWAEAWTELSKTEKQRFFDLPNFDANIFKEITGIDVIKENKSCHGKVVEIDGKVYELKEIKK